MTLDEFARRPGPSGSHDRSSASPRYLRTLHQTAGAATPKATALKVHLFGSLSTWQGARHGARRTAGLIGKEPATVEPAFLTVCADNPEQSFPVKLGTATVNAASGHHLRRPRATSPPEHHDGEAHGATMSCSAECPVGVDSSSGRDTRFPRRARPTPFDDE
jgi:hypothetical protein